MKKSATLLSLQTPDLVEDIESSDTKSIGKASSHSQSDDITCENCNGNSELPKLNMMNNNHDDDDDLVNFFLKLILCKDFY